MMKRLWETKRHEEGFSLIELLVVIVILGILAGVVVFAVGGITDKGEKSACKADYKTIQTAEEAYRAQEGHTSYATIAELVTAGLLSKDVNTSPATGDGATKYYEVKTPGATYAITPVSGSGCTAPPTA